MTYALPPLDWLRAFEAAARHRSFAAAAREVNLTPAAVSQQVRALESHFGAALFERLPRGLRLTTTGHAYLPAVGEALAGLSAATAGLFGAAARREVTLRCPASFASLCLAPELARFRAAHPGIAVRLYTAIWSGDLHDDRVDLEIRYGAGRWDGFEAAALSGDVSAVVVPPGSAATDPGSLIGAGVVHVIGCENLWDRLARAQGLGARPVKALASVDSSLVALELVAAGTGSAIILEELAAGHLAAGRVARVPGLELAHGDAHWLLTPRRTRLPAPAALLLRDWLAAALRPGRAAA